MLDFLRRLFSADGFYPRWMCGQEWSQDLINLHILCDLAIFGSYAAIAILLANIVRKRRETPFPPIVWLFAGFIAFCGLTHLIEAFMFHWPAYYLAGYLKLLTAIVSGITTMVLLGLMHKMIELPGLHRVNEQLRAEVKKRRRMEKKLQQRRRGLRERVEQRTRELQMANGQFMAEIAEHQETTRRLRAREAELKAAEAALAARVDDALQRLAVSQQNEAILAAIVENSDDAIIGQTLEGKILSWNYGAQATYGYTPEEAIGQPIGLIHPGDDTEAADDLLHRLRNGESIRHWETRRRRKDGLVIPVSLTLSTIEDQDGTVMAASSIERNITRDVRHREQLRRYARRLEESNRDLQQFAYVASHDLKAPLRAVAGYIQLLERRYADALDETARTYISGAVENAQQMSTLINDLLAFSRVQRSGSKLEMTALDGPLQRALQALEVPIGESAAEISHDPLPQVFCDPTLIANLFQNLIGNALKFRNPEETPRIYIAAEPVNDSWRISVRDNGIGIPEKYQEKIFEIFKRLHSARKHPGTGIGLAICKRIVDRHGGTLTVTSTRDQGSTFTFTLPQRGEETP